MFQQFYLSFQALMTISDFKLLSLRAWCLSFLNGLKPGEFCQSMPQDVGLYQLKTSSRVLIWWCWPHFDMLQRISLCTLSQLRLFQLRLFLELFTQSLVVEDVFQIWLFFLVGFRELLHPFDLILARICWQSAHGALKIFRLNSEWSSNVQFREESESWDLGQMFRFCHSKIWSQLQGGKHFAWSSYQ